MATDYLEAAQQMAAAVQRLVARLQKGDAPPSVVKALATDARTLSYNLEQAAAQQAQDEGDVPVPNADDPRFTADAKDTTVYIHGGTANGNPNGPDWTNGDAVRWFSYVWANNVGYHHVRPTLLPGSHVLSAQGYQYAIDFQGRSGLEEAPEDFNPLDLTIVP